MGNWNGMTVVENTCDMEVLYSGTLHIYGEKGKANVIIDSSLTINFIFETKGGIPAGRINFDGKGNEMTLTFYNFYSALREGTSKPIKIGKYDDKDLYVSICVLTYKEKYRLVHYCFLSKDE